MTSTDANFTEVISHSYHWEFEDEATDDDRIAIRAWTLNRNSEPNLIRFMDFPAFCYVELPLYVNRRLFQWSRNRTDLVFSYLVKVLHEDAPEKCIFKMSEKIYYYRQGRKYPMMLLTFKSLKSLRRCKAILNRPQNIPDLGMVACKVWEDDILPIRKMLTAKKLFYSQWFSVKASNVKDTDKVSRLKNEYFASWRDVNPIDQDVTANWVTNPGILAFDIETHTDNHRAMPNKYNENHPSYMISAIYQRTGLPETRKRYMILMGDCNDIPGVSIIKVKDEREECKAFTDVIAETDPEIITGYNIFGYDYPYLQARLSRYIDSDWDEKASRLLGRTPNYVGGNWSSSGYGHNSTEHVNFPGRISVDLLPVIRRDYKMPKYDLNTVGNYFLGRGKHDVSPQEMFRIYEELTVTTRLYQECIKGWTVVDSDDGEVESEPIYHDNIDPSVIEKVKTYYEQGKAQMTRVALYCIEDSELVLDIIEKITLWVAMTELSNIAAVNMMDLFTRGQQVRGISQIYNLAATLDVVIDKRKTDRIEFSGGFVFEPVPGLFDQTICLDFKSLYPNIMIAKNVCYSTLVPPELDRVVPDSDCNVIEWDDEIEVPANATSKDGENEEDGEYADMPDLEVVVKKTHYRYRFIKKELKEGILPRLVGKLIDDRNVVRARQKNEKDPVIYNVLEQRQLALKVCSNSMYGMLGVQPKADGSGEGKLPLIEGAMSVTATGRTLIQWCNKYIEDKYNGLVVYNDTDSTMVKLPFVKNDIEALEWGEKLEKEISDQFPDPLYLEFEKAGRIFCIRKKKYAYWLIDTRKNIRNKNHDPTNPESKEWIPNPGYGKLRDPKTDNDAIMTKGIVLARRDNCQWQRDLYKDVLEKIMTLQPMQDTLDVIIGEVVKMSRNEIDWKTLTLIKGLGSNYKNDTYFMKVFSDELRRIGKPAAPGDRLEYLIVKPNEAPTKPNGDILLGYKMRLTDTYIERLKSSQPEPVDTHYYIENVIKNCIEQLWMIGYKDQIAEIERRGQYDDQLRVLHKIISLGHADIVNQKYAECGQDPEKTVEALMEVHGLKTKTLAARREFITGRGVFHMRICKNIIKLMLKAIDRECLDQLVRTLASPNVSNKLVGNSNGVILNITG
jgi:DNA polymerase elongation subunit (family B)